MGALLDTLKVAGLKNIRNVGWTGGEYLSAMAKGAGIGAGLGGVSEWSSGGSFWSGAKSGAFTGAMVGGGYRAAKIGATGNDWAKSTISDAWEGYGNIYKPVAEGYKLAKEGAAGLTKEGVSKQVTDIIGNKKTVNYAKNVFKLGGA